MTSKLSFKQLEGTEPLRFTGLSGQESADTWLSKMDSHVELMKAVDGSLSDRAVLRMLSRF